MEDKSGGTKNVSQLLLQYLIPVHQKIRLPNHKYLEVLYANPASIADRSAQSYTVIVLPGGGYEYCSYSEGRVVAQAFAQRGFNAAVLNYSCKGYVDVLKDHQGIGLNPMIELASAIDILRTEPKWGLSNSKIVVCGFSAGGHLAASMCTRYNEPQLLEAKPWKGSLRPDGAVLCYPVISSDPDIVHKSTFTVLTGSSNNEDWTACSCEKLVDENTPPAYIWHNSKDTLVTVQNSVCYAQSMWKHGCTAELEIFPRGNHGCSLAIDGVEPSGHSESADPYIAVWLERAVKFIRTFV